MNRLGQRGETELGWNTAAYVARARAFGWNVVEIDGHDLAQIDQAFDVAAQPREKPTLIVAKTVKGRGVSFLENQDGWHGKALSPPQAEQAIKELGGLRAVTVSVLPPPAAPTGSLTRSSDRHAALALPSYDLGASVATRKAYGEALRALGAARSDVVVLDAEVSNSTHAEDFGKAFPDRFFEMYIAEQQLLAAAIGLNVRHWVPFASTFAAFLSRAYDFVRMGAISRTNIRLCGSHAGVSIGEDGPSQMALEDLAMMRAVHGSTVLYPCDANATAQLVAAMADLQGISFLRTTRATTPTIYSANERFVVGGSRIVRKSDGDTVTVVAAGITVHEALKAHAELQKEGVTFRLIDAYSVKPIDTRALHDAARATDGRIVVVEDHWPEGGLGSAVQSAFTIEEGWNGSPSLRLLHLAVRALPGSGSPPELLDAAGISARHIADAVRQLAKNQT